MMWLMWRRHRTTWLAMSGLMVVCAAIAVVGSSLVAAAGEAPSPPSFARMSHEFFLVGSVALPLVVGVFLGCALFASEIERGTHLYALTQSVGRARWFWVQTGMAIGAAAVVGAAWSVTYWWTWAPVISGADGPALDYAGFIATGAAPVVHCALGAAVGGVAGLVIGRTWPSVAVTLVLCLGVRVGMAFGYRHYLDPAEFAAPMTMNGLSVAGEAAVIESGWITSSGTRLAYGDPGFQTVFDDCFPVDNTAADEDMRSCLVDNGIVQDYALAYLPADFWALTFIEAGIAVALVGAVVAVGAVWARAKVA